MGRKEFYEFGVAGPCPWADTLFNRLTSSASYSAYGNIYAVSLPRAALYVVAQCLGAVCGVGLVKAVHSPAHFDRYGGGENVVDDGYGKGTGLVAEVVGTFVLVYTVFSATDAKRSPRTSRFAVFVVHLDTIPITGTGINPARSFGAAVVYNQAKAWHDQWIFWVGPPTGAAIATLYDEHVHALKALGSLNAG